MAEKTNGTGKIITWIIGLLVLIAMAVSGYTVGRVDKIQNALASDYVQKIDYNRDRVELKELIKSMDIKIDRLLRK
ncbi:MAG: hypothetical protein Q7J85_07090 [Bacillota bacterium]|nr:hypothetical protein [Bacillota bacterium]